MDSKANLKRLNRSRILNAIREYGQISKRRLQEITGLSWSTISMLTSELVEEGFLCVVSKQNNFVGRRPEMIGVNPNNNVFIGIDVNCYDFRVIVTDLCGNILRRNIFKDIPMERDIIIARLFSAVDAIIKDCKPGSVRAISFSVQGAVDSEGGESINIYYIKNWRNVQLKKMFSERYALPVFVFHDAFCALKAEIFLEAAARNSHSAIMIYYAPKIGISAPVVLDGNIYTGFGGRAGEIGLMIVPDGTGKDSCLLERVITESAVLHEYQQHFPKTESFEEVAYAAQSGEKTARDIFELLGYHIGIAVANCVNLFDPELVLLGGMHVPYAELYKERIITTIKKNIASNIRILISEQDENYTAIGAALMAVEKVMDTFYWTD